MIEKIIITIMWFFIIIGAIIVTKICLWGLHQDDSTSIFVSLFLLSITWFTTVIGLIKTVKKTK
jgi:hypothetical protein